MKTTAATETLLYINNATFFAANFMLVAVILLPMVLVPSNWYASPDGVAKFLAFLLFPSLFFVSVNAYLLPLIGLTTNSALYGGLMSKTPVYFRRAEDRAGQSAPIESLNALGEPHKSWTAAATDGTFFCFVLSSSFRPVET